MWRIRSSDEPLRLARIRRQLLRDHRVLDVEPLEPSTVAVEQQRDVSKVQHRSCCYYNKPSSTDRLTCHPCDSVCVTHQWHCKRTDAIQNHEIYNCDDNCTRR